MSSSAVTPPAEERNRVADAVILATASFVFSLVLILQIVAPLKGLTGDEPHYLVVAHSLVSDFDLDLRDDYGAEKAWTTFYRGAELAPHYAPGRGGHYSTRSIGLAMWLAPFYAFGLALGDPVFWCRFSMAILGALFIALTYLLCRDMGAGRGSSLFAGVLLAFSVPAAFYTFAIYPEIAAGLLCIVALRLHLRRRSEGVLRPLLIGLCLALLPWLGLKYAVLAVAFGAGFAIAFLREIRAALRPLAALAVAPVISALLFALFLWLSYGSLSPSVIYTGVGPEARPTAGINQQSVSAEEGPVAGAVRMAALYFIDQRDGILFYSPFWLLGIAGVILVLLARTRGAWLMSAAFAAYWIVYALSHWTGGHAPPGRPLTAVIWVLAVGLAFTGERIRGYLPLLFTTASVAIAACFTLFFVFHNHLAYHVILAHTEAVGNNLLASIILPVDLTALFPNLVNPRDIHPLPTLIFITAVLAGILLLVRAGAGGVKPPQVIRPAGWAPLILAGAVPALLFLVAAFSAETFADEEMQGRGAVRLVFRDNSTFGYEPFERDGSELPSFWTRGGTAARVNVVCGRRPKSLVLEFMSLETQTVRVTIEGREQEIELKRGSWRRLAIPGEYAGAWTGRALFRLDIVTPRGRTPAGGDTRHLGCRVVVSAIDSPA